MATALESREKEIVDAFAKEQGQLADIGGYYVPKADLLKKWMRPVDAFNQIVDSL